MNITKTKALIALAISGAMSATTASASVLDNDFETTNSIISVDSPDLKVTVYDGIATLIGNAATSEEARFAEEQIGDVQGVEHVINMITWG